MSDYKYNMINVINLNYITVCLSIFIILIFVYFTISTISVDAPTPLHPLWELEKNFFLEFCVISSHLAIPVTKHKQKKKEVLHIVITLFTFFLHPMWINLRTSEELKKKIIQKLINQPNQTNQTSLKKFKNKNWNNRNWTNQMNWFNYI